MRHGARSRPPAAVRRMFVVVPAFNEAAIVEKNRPPLPVHGSLEDEYHGDCLRQRRSADSTADSSRRSPGRGADILFCTTM